MLISLGKFTESVLAFISFVISLINIVVIEYVCGLPRLPVGRLGRVWSYTLVSWYRFQLYLTICALIFFVRMFTITFLIFLNVSISLTHMYLTLWFSLEHKHQRIHYKVVSPFINQLSDYSLWSMSTNPRFPLLYPTNLLGITCFYKDVLQQYLHAWNPW